MLHQISSAGLPPQAGAMTGAIEACVHCGFCLAACPTYRHLGEEMDSPRGRIFLMKEALEGNLEADQVRPYLDACLGCLACEPACPSGVAYHELLHPFRHHTHKSTSLLGRWKRSLLHAILPSPSLFRAALLCGRALAPMKPLLPPRLRLAVTVAASLRRRGADPSPLPETFPARGKRRARVALLLGCVQQVLRPRISWATARVLAQNGVEVITPPGQGCCGALALHEGEWRQARRSARRNLEAFPRDVDAVVTNAAGCGSGMLEYPLLFAGAEELAQAQELAAKVEDVTVLLARLGLHPPPAGLASAEKVAYQDPCHLAHAQGVRREPRQLLESVPNLTLVELPPGDACCGSAGTYNLEHPELAWELGAALGARLVESGADSVATGNIGCLVQMEVHLQARRRSLPVFHTMEVLDRAYGEPGYA